MNETAQEQKTLTNNLQSKSQAPTNENKNQHEYQINTKYILETFIIMLLLFLLSFRATLFLWAFAGNREYFTFGGGYIFKVSATLLLLCYVFAISIGSWRRWEHYLTVPFPIAFGVFLVAASSSLKWGLVIFVVSYLIMVNNIKVSTNLIDNLIKINPRIVLRIPIKSILFMFSVVAAALILLHPAGQQSYDVGQAIADLTSKYLDQFIQQRPDLQAIQALGFEEFDFTTLITDKINNAIEPYKRFVMPIIALLVFGSFQIITLIVFWVFNITIGMLFGLAKRLNIISIEYIDVKKEIIKF